VLAKEKFGIRGRELHELGQAHFVEFTAQTRMSGVDFDGQRIRKGAAESVKRFAELLGGKFPAEVQSVVERVAREGGTPLVVADGGRVLGVIQLEDIVKGGMKQRFARLREMGIKTVMVTG